MTSPGFSWQPSLFSSGQPVDFDRSFASVERIPLDDDSWVDHGPGWVRGADRLYDEVVATRDWGQRQRRMWDKQVTEPRLTSSWSVATGVALEPPIVVLVSVGEPRRFLLKPKAGGPSRAFFLGEGDLLVTGGNTQRTWLHSVPKVKQAGPRISIAYRHGFVAPPPGEEMNDRRP